MSGFIYAQRLHEDVILQIISRTDHHIYGLNLHFHQIPHLTVHRPNLALTAFDSSAWNLAMGQALQCTWPHLPRPFSYHMRLQDSHLTSVLVLIAIWLLIVGSAAGKSERVVMIVGFGGLYTG